MKTSKTSGTKGNAKPAAPAKMMSALTNLDRMVQTAPVVEAKPATNGKSEAKPVANGESGAKPVTHGKSERKSRLSEPARTESKPAQLSDTTVLVKLDVGFGNMLFIRGHGPGLSWDKGVPMDCRDHTTWQWSAQIERERVEFKLLLNDMVWAGGETLTVAPGEKIEVVPSF